MVIEVAGNPARQCYRSADTLAERRPEQKRLTIRNRKPFLYLVAGQDLNLRPSGYEPENQGIYRHSAPGPLAPLLALRLVEITPERMTDWLKEESAGRATQTLLAFGLFKTFGVWCEERADYRGLLDPAATRSPP